MKQILKMLFIFGIIFLLFSGYSFFIEPNVLKIEKPVFKLDCLEQNLNKKFIQISDLHFNTRNEERKINRIYFAIKNLEPDVVFITGDLIGKKQGVESAVKLVEEISKHYPVFVVFGNWDYWALDFKIKEFKKELENAGADVLINKAIVFNGINIIGIKDPYTSDDSEGDLNRAMRQIIKKENCKLLLAHSPDIFEISVKQNIDLVLTGHTHGGQVFIPFITKKIIPSRYPDNKKFIKGFYAREKTQMYVNKGIGGSKINIRFLVPPEITSIELQNSK